MALTVTADYTALLTDEVILVDSTTGPVTVTLPSLHPRGKRYYIKDKYGTTDSNPITVTATPNEVDSLLSYVLSVETQAILAHSDGYNWWIL